MDGDIVRVLIVEDDPAFRDLYMLFLQADAGQHYEPIAVDTGGGGHRDLWPRAAGLRDLRFPTA